MQVYKPRFFEKKAGVFKRLIAFILDIFVLNFVVLSPFQKLLEPYLSEGFVFFASYDAKLYVILTMISLISLGYFVLMELYYKKTIGMILLKIEVGGELTLLKAIARHLYLIPVFPFSLLILIDPLYLVLKGERLSEKLTKTKTVEYIRMV